MKHVMYGLPASRGITSVSFAQSMDHFGRLTVAEPQECPSGTTAMAYYKYQEGMFVRMGWICEERISSRS